MLPPFPSALEYVWQWFLRLSRRRGSNGFGYQPIGWTDIDAFSRHARVRLTPFEIECIEDLDGAYLTAVAKAQKASTSS